MKKLLVALFLSPLIATMPVGASAFKSISRVNGNAAVAEWQSMEGDILHDTYVSVNESNMGSDLFVGVCDVDTITWIPIQCSSGYLFTTSKILTTDSKLNSAVLAPTSVDLYDMNNVFVGSTTVSATWTGVGKAVKGSMSFKSKYGGFTQMFKGQSTERNATATGSMNATSLGSTNMALIVQFKQMDMVRVK